MTTRGKAGGGFNKPVDPETARRNVPTGIFKKLMDGLGRTLTTVPEGHLIHPTLGYVTLDATAPAAHITATPSA